METEDPRGLTEEQRAALACAAEAHLLRRARDKVGQFFHAAGRTPGDGLRVDHSVVAELMELGYLVHAEDRAVRITPAGHRALTGGGRAA